MDTGIHTGEAGDRRRGLLAIPRGGTADRRETPGR